MTLGVTNATHRAPQSAVADRRLTRATSGAFGASSPFEVSRTDDPSDGANYSGGSSYSEGMPLSPSSAGLAGVLGASSEDILQKIAGSDAYLARMGGKSWPSVATPPNFLRPTSYAQKSSINKGWNAAAQPGPAPGLAGCGCQKQPASGGVSGLRGFKEVNVGPMSWEEALLYAPAPLTENPGALRGLDEIYTEAKVDLGASGGDTTDWALWGLYGAAAYGLYRMFRR